MKDLLLKIKHYIAFHTAIAQPYPNGPYNPDENKIGAIVKLRNDPKGTEYEVLRSGPISRGPVRQFPPSISFLCKSPMYGYEGEYYNYDWFRKDSLVFIR